MFFSCSPVYHHRRRSAFLRQAASRLCSCPVASCFLPYVERPVLSPVHSDCWVAAGTTGSGTRSITHSSCLQRGHREYRNQDLTSCKRMPARGRVSSCWQCLQRKTRCFIHFPSYRDNDVDTRLVCWQGGATSPQPGDLDMDSSKMTGFLLLQDVHSLLPGQANNELCEPCLLRRIHLVDPCALSGDQERS